MKRICLLLATGMGLGYSPIASGTVGTVWGLLIVWGIDSLPGLTLTAYIIVSAVLVFVAIPICDVAEKVLGKKDDGRIVADEYLTFPICMIGLPVTPLVLGIAFLSNRFFDIWKPPPARQLQRLSGGLGVVIDDVLAALYSLALNHVVYALFLR